MHSLFHTDYNFESADIFTGMTPSEAQAFWQGARSFICSSMQNCDTFLEIGGLEALLLTITSHSNYGTNKSLVQIVGYIASVESSTEVIGRHEILNFMELIADSHSYKDKKVTCYSNYINFSLQLHILH